MEHIERLYQQGILTELDVRFARFIGRLASQASPALVLAAALVSDATRRGHVCLDLSNPPDIGMPDENGAGPVTCPELPEWVETLAASDVVGEAGQFKPLILDDQSRLYLWRYYDYQAKLARAIRYRVDRPLLVPPVPDVRKTLDRLFPDRGIPGADWQKIAAAAAMTRPFLVISGGPGTGKTTTVAKILALLMEQAGEAPDRIALAAPTGKAAARLAGALLSTLKTLDCPSAVKTRFPHEAKTIHRLLGTIPGSPFFRFNGRNRLPFDTVIVDEASMVDLALLSKLCQALAPEARLVLLGDRDQLASVEAGAVLGDICDTGHIHPCSRRFQGVMEELTGCRIQTPSQDETAGGMQDSVLQLVEGYRFGPGSNIQALGNAVNSGDEDRVMDILRAGDRVDVAWRPLPDIDRLSASLKPLLDSHVADYRKTDVPAEAFERFERFRILCAVREGPYGVVSLNRIIERILTGRHPMASQPEWYAGRPIMVTRNDYNLRLFNGDVGLILPDSASDNRLRAFFPDPVGHFRTFHPIRLPEHESVYAMTVHKSQGSEFDRVVIILPDRDVPVLTRELLYTGITRTREHVEIWGQEPMVRSAVSRRIRRHSGLRDALWRTL